MAARSAHIASRVVVKCADRSDVLFKARWLAQAADADVLLDLYRKTRPDFTPAIERRLGFKTPGLRFSTAAMAFINLGLKEPHAFTLDLLDSRWGLSFAFMAAEGFFRFTGSHYVMAVPRYLSAETVSRGLLRVVATQDNNGDFRLNWLVKTVSKGEATLLTLLIERGNARTSGKLFEPDAQARNDNPVSLDLHRIEVLLFELERALVDSSAAIELLVHCLHSASNGNPAVEPLLLRAFQEWPAIRSPWAAKRLQALWESFDFEPPLPDAVAILKGFSLSLPAPLASQLISEIFDHPSSDFSATYQAWQRSHPWPYYVTKQKTPSLKTSVESDQ